MAQEILISINVNSGKAEANLGNAKQSVDKLAAAQKRLKDAESATAIEIAKVNIQTKEQIALNNQAAAALLKNTKKGSTQFRTQVGLNNAILQEAGRAASDARFGFNGVANNVGQLASLFGSLINTSDNVVTSLKNLGKSLLGTGGLLIAVQLLIAYGDRVYAFFFETDAAASKLKSTMEGLVKPINENRFELLGYVEVLKDATSSEKARLEAMEAIKDAVPDAIDDNGNLKLSYDDLTIAVENYINQLLIRAEIEALVELNSDTFNRKRKLRDIDSIEDTDKRREAIEKLIEEDSNFYDGVVLGSKVVEARSAIAKDAAENDLRTEEQKNEDLIKSIEKFNSDVANSDAKRIEIRSQSERDLSDQKNKQIETDFKAILKSSEIESDAVLKGIVELQKKLEGLAKKEGGSGSGKDSRIKIFKEGILQLEKLEESYRQKSIDQDLLTEEEKIENKRQANLKSLQITVDDFEEKELVRLNAYVKEINERKLTDEKKQELIDDANVAFIRSIEKSEDDAADVRVQINEEANTKLNQLDRQRAELSRKETEKRLDLERSLEMQRVETLKIGFGNELVYFEARAKLLLKEVQRQKMLVDATKEGSLQRIEAEQRFFKAKQKFLDNDLLKEKSIAKEKMRVNQQYISFAQSMQAILTGLAGENEALQKAALIFEKGAAIADVAIKANAANAVIVSSTTAAAAATLARYGGIIPAAAPEMAAIAAKGTALTAANNVGAGLSIAAILATGYSQYQLIGKSSQSSSAGTGSGDVQAPDFNVVGTSSVDQLAQTVAGQTKEPIKAYVVGKEITNQQEFDRNIVNTAGI